MATFIFPRAQVSVPGVATEATQLLVLAELVSANVKLASVDSELDTQTTLLTTIDADTGAIATSSSAIQVSTASVDTKLTTTNNELASVNSELDAQTALLTTIDADTGAIATSAASVDTKLTTTNSELVSVNSELDSQTALLTTIDADTGAIATSVASVDTKLTTTNSELALINSELDTQTTHLSQIETAVEALESAQNLTVVDFIDNTPLLDVSGSNIPASSALPLQIVSSLAADVKKVQIIEDIGQYIGLYTGAAASEVLAAVLPLGGGEVSVQIPAGTRVSLRAMKNTAITTDFIAINFLG